MALADYGSLSAAARTCGVAQTNVSRSMARLERSLGVTLVHRATTGSRLTPDSTLVVEWARAVLTAATALRDGVAALGSSASTSLTVMASQTVAEHLLLERITEGRATTPASCIAVYVANASEVLNAARAGEIDLGFVECRHPAGRLHSITVGTARSSSAWPRRPPSHDASPSMPPSWPPRHS